MQEWKVVCRYDSGARDARIVRGWKPIRQLIRQAQATPGARFVDVGPKIGPSLMHYEIQQ